MSTEFPPFGGLNLKFRPVPGKGDDLAEVHLFTGVNGTGKTRLLSFLCAVLGNQGPLKTRLCGENNEIRFVVSDKLDPESEPVRSANFSVSRMHGGMWLHGASPAQWAGSVPAFAYSGAAYLADAQIPPVGPTPRPDRAQCLSFGRAEATSKDLLQAISNLVVQAGVALAPRRAGAKDPGTPREAELLVTLESALQDITGRACRFSFRGPTNPQLAVVWGGTSLLFSALPDGLRSIIGWLAHALVMMHVWLQGEGDPSQSEAVFLLDEVETHLHPAWQRRVLPAFQRLFPKAQIFIATHSPFVIASLNYGWIHALSLGADGIVQSRSFEASRGDSYITAVEDIMGVKEWYDPESEELLRQFKEVREAAYGGDNRAQQEARKLAERIGKRSPELSFVMGRELAQMDRQLRVGRGEHAQVSPSR